MKIKKTNPPKKELPVLEKPNKEISYTRSYRALQTMKRRDIQRECVTRGLSFDKIPLFSTPELISWFQEHFEDSQDESLLTYYDVWVSEELDKCGYSKDDPIRSPLFKLGLGGNPKEWSNADLRKSLNKENKTEKVKQTKISVSTKPTKGAVKQGTKKAYTFQLAVENNGDTWIKNKEEIIKFVIKSFPEVTESSIRAWISKARKLTQISTR